MIWSNISLPAGEAVLVILVVVTHQHPTQDGRERRGQAYPSLLRRPSRVLLSPAFSILEEEGVGRPRLPLEIGRPL